MAQRVDINLTSTKDKKIVRRKKRLRYAVKTQVVSSEFSGKENIIRAHVEVYRRVPICHHSIKIFGAKLGLKSMILEWNPILKNKER